MHFLSAAPLTLLADASTASSAMRSYITPAITTLCVLASLACTFFLVVGGMRYMTSSGNPEKLEEAKKILRNAVIGLVLVIAAATVTAILTHAYSAASGPMNDKFPAITEQIQDNSKPSFWDIATKYVIKILKTTVDDLGTPFVNALGYFTNSTPLMGDNSNVFNIWAAVLGITDILFIGVVALLGFHIMSFTSLGLEEIDIKQILPQLAFVFLGINFSIFAIDGIITLSNAMIHALQVAFPCTSIWDLLKQVTDKSGNLGLGGLLVMLAFVVLTGWLLVYYVFRLITLYIGTILSPLVMLLWLLPAFKDFAITAAKLFMTTIFVLFVQVVIMQLASSMFTGMLQGDNGGQPNTLMALIVGLATLMALLKTQEAMKELSFASSGPKAAREVAGSFMRGVSYLHKTERRTLNATKKTASFVKKHTGSKSSKGSSGGSSKKPTVKPTKPPAPSLKTGETKRAASPAAKSKPSKEEKK